MAVRDPETARGSGFTRPRILGNHGGIPTSPHPNTTRAGERGGSSPSRPGGGSLPKSRPLTAPLPGSHFQWVLAAGDQGWDTHGGSWGAGSSRLTILARETLRKRKASRC